MAQNPQFLYGIEHEVAFLRPDGRFADFSNTSHEELAALIEPLPLYAGDTMLRRGDIGIKVKRWYIEGHERYTDGGQFRRSVPKGIEVRTPTYRSIEKTVASLMENYRLLSLEAHKQGFQPTWISFNPFQAEYLPVSPLTTYEQANRPENRTANIWMRSYGPDLNLSCSNMTDAMLVDTAQKLTAYSPYIVPFSFSSPFLFGKRFAGLSARTAIRTGDRTAVLVFPKDSRYLVETVPSLTESARIPTEAGRIEFKAFDTCRDPLLYRALLALLKGLVVDRTLSNRAFVPDKALHVRAAGTGFHDEQIYQTARTVVETVWQALSGDPDQNYLEPLVHMLDQKITPAEQLIETFERTGSIEQTLKKYASLNC